MVKSSFFNPCPLFFDIWKNQTNCRLKIKCVQVIKCRCIQYRFGHRSKHFSLVQNKIIFRSLSLHDHFDFKMENILATLISMSSSRVRFEICCRSKAFSHTSTYVFPTDVSTISEMVEPVTPTRSKVTVLRMGVT